MTSPYQEFIDALQALAANRDVIKDTHGNLSMRVDGRLGSNGFLIKPSGMPYEEIDIDDVVFMNTDTHTYASPRGRKPSVDLEHHRRIYERYPDIKAICHTHSPHVVAHAAIGVGMKAFCTEMADYFGDRVMCTVYAGPNEWGKVVDGAMESDTRALILCRHGGLTFGRSKTRPALEAVKLAVALEGLAEKHTLATMLSLGTFHTTPPAGPLPMDEIDVAEWHKRYWGGGYGQ